MTTDRREQILARVFAILETIDGMETVTRNRGELPDQRRPAIVMLDADEIADERAYERSGRPAYAPNLVNLTPEIYFLLGGRPETRDIGVELNNIRTKILKAVMTDTELAIIIGSNGAIRYNGCVTDLATNRSMQGEMEIGFTFRYVLDPREL